MGGRLEDKVAIIKGGTSGIGRRAVKIFAEKGASVLIAARRADYGRELADRLGDKVDFLKTDVSSETEVKRMTVIIWWWMAV
jgi:3(or 17)beta-hydroxysteroid dehydrogenase